MSIELLLGSADRTSPFLESIDWEQPLADSITAVRGLLQTVSTRELKDAIASRRKNVSAEDARILEAASAERPLTLKHCVALGSTAKPTKIWVNQYREEAWAVGVGGRYIERYHNHRAAIIAKLVKGGYTADEWRYPDGLPERPMDSKSFDDWGPKRQGLVACETTYREGDVMWLHPDEIHRLRDIQPGTVSFLVEAPRTRDYSFVFDPEGQKPMIMYPDMGGHYDSLAEQYAQGV